MKSIRIGKPSNAPRVSFYHHGLQIPKFVGAGATD